jgi:phosphotriesterase-related protein
MAQIETVNGPIDADALGRTLIHEHFRFRDEGAAMQFPHLYDEADEMEKALADARAVMSHDIKTVVDPNAMTGSRSAEFSKRVADETGVQIVLATGIYTYDYLPQVFQNRDPDQVAACYVHDIEEGMQGTDVKAAFIKCACDEPGMTPNVEKLHRASARASLQTGKPIMAHSRPENTTGLDQMRVFTEEGVDPTKVQIAHTGDTDDLDYIEKLLDTGCWIGLDRYGLDLFLATDRRNATTTALLERGYADRMFLSQDYCSTLDWFPPEVQEALRATEVPQWSMTFLFEEVIPTLREDGMTDEQLDTMMVDNPRRWLTS